MTDEIPELLGLVKRLEIWVAIFIILVSYLNLALVIEKYAAK